MNHNQRYDCDSEDGSVLHAATYAASSIHTVLTIEDETRSLTVYLSDADRDRLVYQLRPDLAPPPRYAAERGIGHGWIVHATDRPGDSATAIFRTPDAEARARALADELNADV